MMADHDEDVIELGSSDDETEPDPKKRKIIPMVQIPSKIPGVTIKPANKCKINPISIAKAGIGKGITVTKVSGGTKLSNPFATKNKLNGRPTVKPTVQIPKFKPVIPILNQALTVTPTLKRFRQVVTSSVPFKLAKGVSTAPTVIRPLPAGILPPGITVKRTSQLQSASKPNMKANHAKIQAKVKANLAASKIAKQGQMVCVNLDDDDAPSPVPTGLGPQWYLRPEENKLIEPEEKPNDSKENISEVETGSTLEETADVEKGTTDLEKQNNKEPETPKYIEITIEDSPSKPPPMSKRACEVAEQAITIDDSPVKGPADKPDPTGSSDEDTTTCKEKQSRKMLEYSKTDNNKETVEIEIEPTPVEGPSSQADEGDSQDANVETEIVDVEESPIKCDEYFLTSTPKKQLPKPHLKTTNVKEFNEIKTISKPKPNLNENKSINPSTPGEFHPVYQSFIDLCFQLENSEDMSKIVEKKIKAYYKQVPKQYTESEVFVDMVSSKINAMKAGPEKMYLFIKDIVDELNMQRKIVKSQPVKLDIVNEEQEKFLYGEESEFDLKRQRQIRKLEKTLKKLHRAIQKLEEQEVDFDDEEDSVYLLTESEEGSSKAHQPLETSERLIRYKERMIRVHAKFCQLTNTRMPSEARVQIDARPGQHKGPAKRLEKWINKKVPIGTPLPFPDFHDVLRCVRDANQEDKLGWNEVDIMEEARDLFTRCGKKLQRRRQENEWRLAASRIQSEIDPAEDSEELRRKLEDNRRVTSNKESELLNKYADRQNQLNLEAVEIGDKEADESPVETDDDESTEEKTSLQTKEKRKKRLKRLLQEKATKDTDEKEQSHVDDEKPDEGVEAKASANENDNSKDGNSQMETKEKDPLSNKQNDEEKDPLANKNNETSETEKVHSLSDDSDKIDSDIDELHLLQKLHSDVIDSSTLESSDSESPIAISDTLSSGDNRKQASDVISIENSSYSESEKNNEQEYELVSYSQKKIVTESVNDLIEIECSNAGVEKKINKSNNDEYNESVEDILLASSEDEAKDDDKLSEDPISINKTNVNHSKDSDKISYITDASSMESTEMMVTKNMNSNENNDAIEVTSITSTETGEDDITNAGVITSINSIIAVEEEPSSNSNDNAESSSIKSTETVEEDIMIADKKNEITTPNDNDSEVTSVVEDDMSYDSQPVDTIEDEVMADPEEANIVSMPIKANNIKNVDVNSETTDKVNSVKLAGDKEASNADIDLEITGQVTTTESIENEIKTPNDNDSEVTSVVEDDMSYDSQPVDTIEDEVMADPEEANIVSMPIKANNIKNVDVNSETTDKVNSVKLAGDKEASNADIDLEITGQVTTTESIENEIKTPDELNDADDEVASSDVNSTETVKDKTSNDPEPEDVNNKDSVEDSKGLPAAEPMEVDADIDKT